MSLLSQASPFSDNSNNNGKRVARMKNTFNNIQNIQKGYEYQEPTAMETVSHDNQIKADKINSIIEKMSSTADNDGDNLYDYKPTQNQQTNTNSSVEKIVTPTQNTYDNAALTLSTSGTTTVQRGSGKEAFMNPRSIHKQSGSSYSDSYQPTPYYKGTRPQVENAASSQLMEKLNYMVHLLEEQQKEPTQNIMEEFILYGLLGVFMIYLVDSFARAGKYIR